MGAATAMGLAQWDYAGHQVAFYDFHAPNYRNKTGPVVLHDSSLYFSGVALEGASFGDIALPGSNTFIGCYVDTALLHPYVYDDRHADQYITWNAHDVNDTIYVSTPNGTMELSATSSSGLPVEYHLSNDRVARLSNGPSLWIADTGVCLITATQPGNSYWNAATPKVKVLSIGVEERRIVWTQPLEFTYSDTVIPLNAHFIYGEGTIEYTLPASNGVAEISEWPNKLHLLGPGTIEIDAHCLFNPDSPDNLYHCIRTLTVRPVGSNGIATTTHPVVTVYPNPFWQKVTIQVEKMELKTATAILTDPTGRREEVRLIPIGSGQYSLDLTSRPQATYLLTLTTADGKQHTIRLLKKSDIYTR